MSNSDQSRAQWSNELDFLMSTIGYAVDLANVWRFPYLAYVNGGGAFLIPYFLLLIFGAIPLLYMELYLGQLQQESSISIWKMCPFFKGIGVSQFLVNLTTSCYYNVIIGYCVYYIFATITSVVNVPWMQCNPTYSTQYCVNISQFYQRNQLKANYTQQNLTWPPPNITSRADLSAPEYFERAVLSVQDSSGLDAIGIPRWQLACCSFIVFGMLFFCLWKGIKSSGKIVYVTVILPYVIFIALLIQGCLLQGSRQGIEYFINPQFDKLTSSRVWLDAATQIFYSTGAGFGVHMTFASYNSKKSNVLRNCLITALANSFTSLLAGFTVFAYLGYISSITGQGIQDVANEGPGLVFQVYPVAVGTLPAAPLFSILFFLLLMMLGMDSSMGGIEALVSGIWDEFRDFFKRIRWFKREMLCLIIISCDYLLSLFHATSGGIFTITILDRCIGIPLVLGAFWQAVAVSWFYGMGQFSKDIELSTGFIPSIIWRIFWKVISPLFILIIVIFSLVNLPALNYRFGAYHPELATKINITANLEYTFPSWSSYVFWGVAGVSMIMVPLFMLISLIRYRSFYYAVTPVWEHEELDAGIPASRRKAISWITFGPIKDNSPSKYEMSGNDNPVMNNGFESISEKL